MDRSVGGGGVACRSMERKGEKNKTNKETIVTSTSVCSLCSASPLSKYRNDERSPNIAKYRFINTAQHRNAEPTLKPNQTKPKYKNARQIRTKPVQQRQSPPLIFAVIVFASTLILLCYTLRFLRSGILCGIARPGSTIDGNGIFVCFGARCCWLGFVLAHPGQGSPKKTRYY